MHSFRSPIRKAKKGSMVDSLYRLNRMIIHSYNVPVDNFRALACDHLLISPIQKAHHDLAKLLCRPSVGHVVIAARGVAFRYRTRLSSQASGKVDA